MRAKTGPRKTPDGYYVVVLELEAGEREPIGEGALRELGIEREEAGRVVMYLTRSRRIRDLLLKELAKKGCRVEGWRS